MSNHNKKGHYGNSALGRSNRVQGGKKITHKAVSDAIRYFEAAGGRIEMIPTRWEDQVNRIGGDYEISEPA